jgi:hypothetical protein
VSVATCAAPLFNVLLPPDWSCATQDFDWQALAARRMEPPRRPRTTDHAKRKVGAVCCMRH